MSKPTTITTDSMLKEFDFLSAWRLSDLKKRAFETLAPNNEKLKKTKELLDAIRTFILASDKGPEVDGATQKESLIRSWQDLEIDMQQAYRRGYDAGYQEGKDSARTECG